MKKIRIVKLENDGSQKVLTTCGLGLDGQVTCVGEEPFTSNLLKDGIENYGSNTKKSRLLPSDGQLFLDQLPYNFRSGYLSAIEINE